MTGRAKRRNRTLVGALLAFLGAVQMLVTGIVPAPVSAAQVNPGNLLGFEGEGDHEVGNNGGTLDWGNVVPIIATDPNDPDIGYKGTSKENDPTGWQCQSKDGGITPPKDNLLRGYIYSDITEAQGLLALGFVRADGPKADDPQNGSNKGNTHVNFEFNQGEITFDTSGGNECDYLGRLDGDLLLTFDFPGNSGDPADVDVATWESDPIVPNEGAWVEQSLSSLTSAIVAADNATALLDDLVIAGTQPIAARSFGEAVLDLKELDRQFREKELPGILTCPGFGTASIRSRSSGSSYESALQDFIDPIGVDVSTCASIKIKKVDDLGNPMEGVKFTLHKESDDSEIDSCTTNVDGICEFDDVPPTGEGETYYINEDPESVPAGYEAPENPVMKDITVGFKDDIDLTTEEAKDSWIVNSRQTGWVEITKVLKQTDPEGGEDIDVPLEDKGVLDGATFVLHNDVDGDGVLDDGDDPATLWGTDTPATCTIGVGDSEPGSGKCTIGAVATGKYIVVETVVPDGTTDGGNVPVEILSTHTAEAPLAATYVNYVSPLDIDLDKTGPDFANIGDVFTYTFKVKLTEPTPLHDIVLTENDPDRCDADTLALKSKEGDDPGTYDPTDDVLDPGETWTYECLHTVTLDDPDPLINVATVTGKDNFEREASAEDDHTVDIVYPDLSVDKSAVDGDITAGDDISFTITVDNVGDEKSIAKGVVLDDDLTATGVSGWTVDSVVPDVGTCEISVEGILHCDLGDIAWDDTPIVITISATTDNTDCGDVTNTATVGIGDEAQAGADTNPDNDSDDATVQVSCPDVEIEKSGNGTINAGDDAEFTITVKNNSATSAASDVKVDDLALPSGIAWTTETEECVIADDYSSMTCEFDTLAASGTITILVTGTTDAADCGILHNEVDVSASNEDPTLDDEGNHSEADIEVECPNIEIEKTPDDGVINVGDDAVFTVTVSNTGEGTAYDVTIDDEIPGDNITWVLDPAVSGCSITDNVLSCAFEQLSPDDDPIVIVMTGTTDPADCPSSGDLWFEFDNTAFADASNDDKSDGELFDDGLITVNCPDLDITKIADDDSVSAGSPIGFTIEVTNDGPGTAYDVIVEDDLPDGLDWSIDPATEGCSIEGTGDDQALNCGPADLVSGGSYSVHITASTDENDCGTYDNLASADASNDDEVTDEDDVAVLCPGLNIGKSADSVVVDAGGEVGFSIVVSNIDDGVPPAEGTATDVTVSDPLPEGLEWSIESVVPDVGTCAITDGVLECELGDLEPGDSVEIHVVATSAIADCGDLDNLATADSSNGPEVEDDASILVLCPLDIEIDKDGPSVAHVGDEITYTFSVTNTGEADLVSVEVTDPLCDDEISLDDDADGDTVLAVGETWEYSCTHVITDDDPDPLPNTATAVGTDERDRETDDDDDHLVDIINPAIQIIKTVDNAGPNPGETITFSYEVTNTGDTTLFDVLVTDDQIGDVGTIDELAPGEVVTLTKDDVVQADQSLVNVGTATGEDELGLEVSDTDDEFISIVIPAVITKAQPKVLALTGGQFGMLLFLAGVTILGGGMLTDQARRLQTRRIRAPRHLR